MKPRRIIVVFLIIEFLDELVFGIREAAWPLIQQDLGLDYVQIGILLSVPSVIGNIIEPALGILADTWKRRAVIVGGGIAFAAAMFLIGVSETFAMLLAGFIIFNPASGAFVSISQATLMDLDPERRENNMARWTFAGSLGVVIGPLLLSLAAYTELSWRSLFVGLVVFPLSMAVRVGMLKSSGTEPEGESFFHGIRGALQALQQKGVVRWLVLLEFSDLMLDVLLGFLALYMVNECGISPTAAGTAVAVWTGVGLLGDFALIPLLERVSGTAYLRISAALELILYPAFLLVPQFWMKLVVLGLLGFFNAGWYSILKARLYETLPGKSGTALALNNLSGLIGSSFPFVLGVIADRAGLGISMWLLLMGPVALVVGLPRKASFN